MKLDVLKILPCAINSEARIVLSLFLIFGDFESRCSYKIVLITKRVYSTGNTDNIYRVRCDIKPTSR